MFYAALDFFARNYYFIKSKITMCLFVETSIKTINYNPIGMIYYYYLLNYIFCNFFERFLLFFYCNTRYNDINLYEVTYRDSNMIRTAIINGNMNDVFLYTRKNKQADKMMVFMKCNLILDGTKTSIRNLIRKYDTKTKLYDFINYNYPQLLNIENVLEIEIGSNVYNVRSMNYCLCLEDA